MNNDIEQDARAYAQHAMGMKVGTAGDRIREAYIAGASRPASPAAKHAIDEVRKVLDYYADEIPVGVWQEIASAVDDIPDCETWTAVPHGEHEAASRATREAVTPEQIDDATYALCDYDTDLSDRGNGSPTDAHWRERRADVIRVLGALGITEKGATS